MLTGEVRRDARSEGRFARVDHGIPEFRSTRSNFGFIGSGDGPTALSRK